MDRMLTPHRAPRIEPLRVHEVRSGVRRLGAADCRRRNRARLRSEPAREMLGDREQLIQAVLTSRRNAAQADAGKVIFRTRAGAQITVTETAYSWY